MSSRTRTAETRYTLLVTLLMATMFLVSGAVLAEPAAGSTQGDDASRTSVSRHIIRGGRDKPAENAESVEEYPALAVSGSRDRSSTRAGFAKPGAGSSSAEATSFDFWFYTADVVLFNDDDRDGYFRGLDVLFDVDTTYLAADVYAVLYLSFEGGPWNEYAVTEDFTIFGASGSDEYVIVTDLESGYPTGSYDLLIEVFDAYDGAFLASFGPEDTSELGFLPLEDFFRDEPLPPPVVVVSRGGGGAMDGWLIGAFLLLLVGSAVRRAWRHRNDSLVRIDLPPPCWQPSRSPGGRGERR